MIATNRIGSFAISEAYQEILTHKKLFDEFKVRQNSPGSPHSKTKTIPLRSIDLNTATQAKWQESVHAEDTSYAKLFPHTYRLAMELMKLVDGKRLGGLMLVELAAMSKIKRHTDEGLRAEYYHRFHIIIKGTHEWIANNKNERMTQGDCYWVNNNIEHTVFNMNNTHRWALIVDIQV